MLKSPALIWLNTKLTPALFQAFSRKLNSGIVENTAIEISEMMC